MQGAGWVLLGCFPQVQAKNYFTTIHVIQCFELKIYVYVVYYVSNEYNRNAGLTVDRCDLLVSINITIPLLDAALPLKSIRKTDQLGNFRGNR